MLPTIATKQLGAAIRQRRKALGLNQLQVCAFANVSAPFLHMLEHGKPTVRLDKVLAVLDVLGLGLRLGESPASLEVPDMEGGVDD